MFMKTIQGDLKEPRSKGQRAMMPIGGCVSLPKESNRGCVSQAAAAISPQRRRPRPSRQARDHGRHEPGDQRRTDTVRLGLVVVASVHEPEQQVEVGSDRRTADDQRSPDVPQLAGVSRADGVHREPDQAVTER